MNFYYYFYYFFFVFGLQACLLLVAASSSSSSNIFLSGDVLKDQRYVGRNLLQQPRECPFSFEFANYTILTSKCKGPAYPAKQCCAALGDFACPYAQYINDPSYKCSSDMFSYIQQYTRYPKGLFASECSENIICPNSSIRKCPLSFEFANYTILTSKCKGPAYPTKQCCAALGDFACPYAQYINDPSYKCSSDMFSYIQQYTRYPQGLFASECSENIPCPNSSPISPPDASAVADDNALFVIPQTLIFIFTLLFSA